MANNIEYIQRWNKENTVVINLRLNKERDADVIARLRETGNMTGYVKYLIRKEIRNEGV